MSDYTQILNYTAKDALTTGNPLKLIKGSEFDGELSAISVAIATKFDTGNVASAGEAQTGTSNTVVMTPGRTTSWAQNGIAILEDLRQLAAPGADRLILWDTSAGAAVFMDVTAATAGIEITGTSLRLDLDSLTNVSIASGDEFVVADASDTGLPKAVLYSQILTDLQGTSLLHDSFSDFVANEHIDHTAVTITAGTGLAYTTGGTDISASSTLALDLTTLTAETVVDEDNDLIVVYDASAAAHRKFPIINALSGTALGDGRWYQSSANATAAGVEETIICNIAAEDNLTRGTFSTSTGVYTAGAANTRLLVTAQAQFSALAAGTGIARLVIESPSTTEVQSTQTRNDANSVDKIVGLQVTAVISVLAGATVTIRASTADIAQIDGGQAITNVSIVELA